MDRTDWKAEAKVLRVMLEERTLRLEQVFAELHEARCRGHRVTMVRPYRCQDCYWVSPTLRMPE